MRLKFVICAIIFPCLCFGQVTWFKHIKGWTARQSFVRNDTIFSFGMDEINSSKIISIINGYDLNGKSLFSLPINFDTIEKNPDRITTLANYRTVFKDGNMFIIGTNLRDGGQKSSCYLNFNNLLSNHLVDITIDTFSTYLDELIKIGNSYYIAGDYRFIETQLTELPLSFILKWNKDSKKFIKTYKSQQGASGWVWSYEDMLINKKKTGTYFTHLRYKWDSKGGQWEDYIIKMDTLGNELWKCQPNNRDSINPEGMQMIQKPDGNLLVSWCDNWYRPAKNPQGNPYWAQDNPYSTLWFAEIDSTGKVVWRKNIRKYLSSKLTDTSMHQNLIHSKVIATNNDCVLWTGDFYWNGYKNYLLKTDFNGNPIWFREYQLYPNNTVREDFKPYDITTTPGGDYILTGEYISQPGNVFKNGCQLATIIKVDSFGCLEPGCQKNDTIIAVKTIQKNGFKIYPNPNNGNFTLEIENPAKGVSIEIYDILGNLVKRVIPNRSDKFYPIDANLTGGIYVVRIEQMGEIRNLRLIVK